MAQFIKYVKILYIVNSQIADIYADENFNFIFDVTICHTTLQGQTTQDTNGHNSSISKRQNDQHIKTKT